MVLPKNILDLIYEKKKELEITDLNKELINKYDRIYSFPVIIHYKYLEWKCKNCYFVGTKIKNKFQCSMYCTICGSLHQKQKFKTYCKQCKKSKMIAYRLIPDSSYFCFINKKSWKLLNCLTLIGISFICSFTNRLFVKTDSMITIWIIYWIQYLSSIFTIYNLGFYYPRNIIIKNLWWLLFRTF